MQEVFDQRSVDSDVVRRMSSSTRGVAADAAAAERSRHISSTRCEISSTRPTSAEPRTAPGRSAVADGAPTEPSSQADTISNRSPAARPVGTSRLVASRGGPGRRVGARMVDTSRRAGRVRLSRSRIVERIGALSGSRSRRSVAAAAVAGLLAASVGLAVTELAAGLTDGRSLVVAVGDWVIDHAPHALVDFGKRNFGTNDKTALVFGIVIVSLLFGIALGVVSRRVLAAGATGIAAFGVGRHARGAGGHAAFGRLGRLLRRVRRRGRCLHTVAVLFERPRLPAKRPRLVTVEPFSSSPRARRYWPRRAR